TSNGYGGGITNGAGSKLYLTNCTVSGNTAYGSGGSGTGGGGGGIDNKGTAVTLTNTIVAGNADKSASPAADVRGKVTASYSLIGSTKGTTLLGGSGNNQLNVNALLAPLQDNGGPTQTFALLPGSPAIDAGGSGSGIPTTDQRGTGRPQGSGIDIGA